MPRQRSNTRHSAKHAWPCGRRTPRGSVPQALSAQSLMPQPGPGRARRCQPNRGPKWPSGGPGLVRARGPGGTRPRDTAPPLRLPADALRLRQPSGTQNLSPPPRERGRSRTRSREGFQPGLSPCITLAVGCPVLLCLLNRPVTGEAVDEVAAGAVLGLAGMEPPFPAAARAVPCCALRARTAPGAQQRCVPAWHQDSLQAPQGQQAAGGQVMGRGHQSLMGSREAE